MWTHTVYKPTPASRLRPFIFDWAAGRQTGWLLQLVDIMIGWAAPQHRWTDRASGRYSLSLYISVCAALANRSVTPVLLSRSVLTISSLFPPWSARALPLPPCDPFRNYKHSFHTRSSQHWRSLEPFETSPVRVAFSLQIATHLLCVFALTRSLPGRFVLQWFAAALFQISAITDYRARSWRGYIDRWEYWKLKKGFIWYRKRLKSI